MPEHLLIVDDEDSVRKTLCEWLQANTDVVVHSAADAASALQLAKSQSMDLAILDWNLGGGHNGLQLLEDLRLFCPEIVAILVTAYANQATPLDALRLGVRDYFDKSQGFTQSNLQSAVARQLAELRPRKQQREVHDQLSRFRSAVEKSLATLQTASPVLGGSELQATCARLLQLAQAMTQVDAAVLVWHRFSASSYPTLCYSSSGASPQASNEPLQRMLAGQALGPNQGVIRVSLGQAVRDWSLRLTELEEGHAQAMLLPLRLAPDLLIVLELLKKDLAGFTSDQAVSLERLAQVATDLLRRAAIQVELQGQLLQALEAALRASQSSGTTTKSTFPSTPASIFSALSSDDAAALAEQVKRLRQRFGPEILPFVLRQLQEVERLLDRILGAEAAT